MIPSYPRLVERGLGKEGGRGGGERFIRCTHTQRGKRVREAYGREGVNEVGRNSSFFLPLCWRGSKERRKGKKPVKHTGPRETDSHE